MKLTIDQIPCDLDPSQRIALDYDAQDLADVRSGNKGHALRLRLPATRTNDRIFGFAAEPYTGQRFNGRFILTDQSFQTAFTVDFIPKFLNLILCSFNSFLRCRDIFLVSVSYIFYTFCIKFQSVELSLQVFICCNQRFDSILSIFDRFGIFFHCSVGKIAQTCFDTFNLSTECFYSSFVYCHIQFVVNSSLH